MDSPLVISWIDDNLIIGNTKAVARTIKNLTERFDCEECGELDELWVVRLPELANQP